MFNANTLFASLIWGSVGVGLIIYGKKQASIASFIGGVVMLAASYLATTAWGMSVICVGVIAVMYWVKGRW